MLKRLLIAVKLAFDGRWCHTCGRHDRVPWRCGTWTCWWCDLIPKQGKPGPLAPESKYPVA